MGIGVLVVLWWPVSTASFHDAQHGAHGRRMMVACKHCLGGGGEFLVMGPGGTMVAMLFNENGGLALQQNWWPCSSTSRSNMVIMNV
uniref:Secreted protein n=1 Tax=Meloidogyne incognita TaxID=6306 RepID=A0A914MFM3_MELIC